MSNPVGIEIVPETVGHILQQKNYRVPLSQRSYRWEREHVEDWLKDINGAMLDNGNEYFVGSVVGIRSKGATYIYDGQQRLATTMILIGAIRDYFYWSDDKETSGLIEADWLISKDRKSHEFSSHLALNAEDHQYFHDRILLRPDDNIRKVAKPLSHRESHKRIERAAEIAKDYVRDTIVKGLPVGKFSDALHQWLDFINESLRVIWVQVGDERTAYSIFETMNDRGLKLSAADLLKNHLYSIADDRREEVIQKWQSMTSILETVEGEEENIVEYVRCYWITKYGPTRTKALYDKIKEKTANKTKALTVASDLETVAQDYAAILLSSHPKWASRGESVRAKLDALHAFGVTQVRPLLLAAFRKFTPKEFNILLDACVSWSVRSLLSGVSSGGTIEGYYSRNALKITNGDITKASQVKVDLTKVIPDDERFRIAAASANVSNQHLARYYLRALQKCEDGEAEPQYIPNPSSEITLEHIMPVKPKDGYDHISAEDRRKYLNRLGNQVLLTGTVNSKLGNVNFNEKQPAFAQSKYSLTHEVASYNDWGIAEIEARQKRLAELAVKTWKL